MSSLKKYCIYFVAGKSCPLDDKSCHSTFTLTKQLGNMQTEAKEEESGSVKERACDTLIMCIVTTLNQGLRNGGGIGDVLRRPSSTVCCFVKNNFSLADMHL